MLTLNSGPKLKRNAPASAGKPAGGRTVKHTFLKIIPVIILTGFLGALMSCSAKFGKLPHGERLSRIEASPNYVDGGFRNQISTAVLPEESSFWSSGMRFVFESENRLKPAKPLPMLKTDLKALDREQDVVVWLGHSSIFAQIGGQRILIDPVFSDHASPFFFLIRAFAGEYPYSPDDMPELDYLLISHDHWDHLDYATIMALKPKIKAVVCALGVGSHLEHWGFEADRIHEADWYDSLQLEPDLAIHVLPARHFSGRLLTRGKTLWASFVIESAKRRVFFSGDSGYGPHFSEIGKKFGPIDLAIMENGQYDREWPYIHMRPEEAAQSALELRAKTLLPIHAGRFSISHHAWDDPYKRIEAASRNQAFRLLTPRIGELLELDKADQLFIHWWLEEQ